MIERKNEFAQGAIAAVLSAAALVGSLYINEALEFRDTFIPGTVINGVDASGLTVSEMEEVLGDYGLILKFRDGKDLAVSNDEIDYHYVSDGTLDALMQQQKAEPFAVVWCDLNGLKAVNDTRGHQAGDEYIREACRAICNVFKHSPVYRVGGDEFVAVLTGADFENRASLIERLEAANDEHIRSGGVIIACGMAELRRESDSCFGTVVERADAAMYEDKKRLKLP